MSQVMALMKRLEEAEKTIAELRAGQVQPSSDEGISPRVPSSHTSPPRHTIQSHIPPPSNLARNETATSNVPETGLPSILDQELLPPPQHNTPQVNPHTSAKEPVATELSVDEHGKINYYGPTSAVHEPPRPAQIDSSPEPQASTRASARADARASLAAHAREAATWEEFALGNAALQTGIPRQLMAKLLHIHWNWVSPMFMWVYKPAFIRELSVSPPSNHTRETY